MTRAKDISKILTDADISGNIDVDGTTNLDVVDIDGAVDMASTLAVAGVVTANAGVVVDEMTLDGDTLTATDTFTLDVEGDITLDANGGDILIHDNGTLIATHSNISGTSYRITVGQQDADFVVRGNDGGQGITALTIDMSANGAATFNDKIIATELDISGSIDVDGTTNLDIVDIDGAVNMATTALITGVLTTTAVPLFNGGIDLPTVNTFIKGGGHNVAQVDSSRTYYYGGTDGIQFRTADNASALITMDNAGRWSFVNGNVVDMSSILVYSAIGSGGIAIQMTPSGNHAYVPMKLRNSSGGVIGTIACSTSGTAYNTSSDYRLKENVSYSFDATSRLKQLKPSRFNFIANADTTVDGFLAHEVSSIVPEAITGAKDATESMTNVVLNANGTRLTDDVTQEKWVAGKLSTTDENGNTVDPIYSSDTTWVASKTVPLYQGIDQSKLVPLLVKTIQELEARITALEG